MNELPQKLRNLAENEYRFDDGCWMPVGIVLNKAADYIETLEHSESVLADMLNRQIDHTKEARAEIDTLRGVVDNLREAHDKNIRKSWSTRQISGRGHHCMWRESAEAMEQRSRAAIENRAPLIKPGGERMT